MQVDDKARCQISKQLNSDAFMNPDWEILTNEPYVSGTRIQW